MENVGKAEFAVFVLRCLLNFHVRMMMGSRNYHVQFLNAPQPNDVRIGDLYDGWAEALKEAIRCVMIVHSGEVRDFPEWEKWVGLREESDPSEAET